MTTNNHPANGPVSLERLHQISEILSKASAQSDGGNLGYAMADAVKVIDGAIAAFGAEPVISHDELLELIEGMEVSVDVSTCDADAGHRYFGTVTEISELETAKNGFIMLVQDAKPNFKQAGNSPATPDCWCRTCRPVTMSDMRFVVCPECGNKRCPHANDHRNACTGSNEPGQIGSAYPAAPQQEVK